MKLHRHGVTLESVNESHLDMVLNWRNSDFVRQFMLSDKVISANEHKKWFSTLKNNKDSHFFIISNEDELYGSCCLKVAHDKSAEGGIYAADKTKLNSLVPIKAMCILYDWAFFNQKVNHIKAYIRSNNQRAIRFNQGLGFTIIKSVEDTFHATLTKASFVTRYNKIKFILG